MSKLGVPDPSRLSLCGSLASSERGKPLGMNPERNQPNSIGKEAILMKKLKGTFAVIVTPFMENEDLDEKGLRENIGWYIKEGIHGVICNGSTSEFANLFKEAALYGRMNIFIGGFKDKLTTFQFSLNFI